MPHCCAVVGCGTRGMRDSNSFFRIPAIPQRGTPTFKELKMERRQRWIAALKRSDMTDTKLKYAVICDKHFITGKPAAIRDVNHPDWCFEVSVVKPFNILASAQVWSNYKNKHTVKLLIAICPQGSIIYISFAWKGGGRTTDKQLTLDCGKSEKLLPGDLLLADRGFLIDEAVGLCYAEVKTPAFTRGQKQLGPCQIEESRKISSVRIHVERVIGALRHKYSILSSTLPTYILSDDYTGEIPAVIDQIVTVCCALCNLCPSVVSLD